MKAPISSKVVLKNPRWESPNLFIVKIAPFVDRLRVWLSTYSNSPQIYM